MNYVDIGRKIVYYKLSIGSQFIAKGLLGKEYGRLFSRLFELRQSGDYDDLYDVTKEEIVPFFSKTADFVKRIEEDSNKIRSVVVNKPYIYVC